MQNKQSKGVALLLALFAVTLASALSIFIGNKTYFQSKLHIQSLQRIKAEYLLKSALNVARVLVSQQTATISADPPRDTWGQFTQGVTLPAQFLGVTEPNLSLGLEISPENGKLSLATIKYSPGSSASVLNIDRRWRKIFADLFRVLGFDNDGQADLTGKFRGKVFKSNELVANLIDYVDADGESFPSDEGIPQGIESSLPKGFFPNKPISQISELSNIPGFTAKRIEILTPFVTVEKEQSDRININATTPQVLLALYPDANINSIQQVITYVRGPEGPINKTTIDRELPKFINYNAANSILTDTSKKIQVIARVQFGATRYFLRAIIDKENNASTSSSLPTVSRIEFFG
jgi:type II secretory pathway component PulK